MASPLRVCVVGAGPISREYAMFHFGQATGTVVSSVVDLDLEKARALATDVGSIQAGAAIKNEGSGTLYGATAAETRGTPVPSHTKLSEALAGCDAVYIGTTPGAHAALATEALAADKHVLMEKPLAATAEDADVIVGAAEAASERGLHVGINIGMRWNPALRKMRELALGEGALGPLKSAHLSLHFQQWPRAWQNQPWLATRASGGPLREVGTHFWFGLMELFGHGCVKRVKVAVAYPDGPEGTAAETSAEGILELQEGLPPITISIRTDLSAEKIAERTAEGRSQPEQELRLEVVGETGALVLEDYTTLRRTSPEADAGLLVEDGSYGRVECVQELVAGAAAGGASGEGGEGESKRARRSRVQEEGVTARQGRNAQRLLDAIHGSRGEWVDVNYD